MNALFRASALPLACGSALAVGASMASASAQSTTVNIAQMSPPRLAAPPPLRPAPPGDPAAVDWREANRQVERLGGHAGHLRSAPSVPARDAEPTSRPRGATR
jgi:hypothetical protein